jgi:hypothetical protein
MSRSRYADIAVIPQQTNLLAESLYFRRGEGQRLGYEPISGDPDRMRGRCHENVDCYIKGFPGTVAIRGWFYDAGEHDGVARFHAHSVIQRKGELIEITYSDAHLPFIRHIGSEDEFFEIAQAKPPTISYIYDNEKRVAFEEGCVQSLAGGTPLRE